MKHLQIILLVIIYQNAKSQLMPFLDSGSNYQYYGYFDIKTKKQVVPSIYNFADTFLPEGYAYIGKFNNHISKMGVINSQGKEVLSPSYSIHIYKNEKEFLFPDSKILSIEEYKTNNRVFLDLNRQKIQDFEPLSKLGSQVFYIDSHHIMIDKSSFLYKGKRYSVPDSLEIDVVDLEVPALIVHSKKTNLKGILSWDMKVKVPLIYHEYEFFPKLFYNKAFHSFYKLSDTLLSKYNALSEKEQNVNNINLKYGYPAKVDLRNDALYVIYDRNWDKIGESRADILNHGFMYTCIKDSLFIIFHKSKSHSIFDADMVQTGKIFISIDSAKCKKMESGNNTVSFGGNKILYSYNRDTLGIYKNIDRVNDVVILTDSSNQFSIIDIYANSIRNERDKFIKKVYNYDFFIVKRSDNKFGIIRKDQSVITPFIYDSIQVMLNHSADSFKLLAFLVQRSQLYGIVDSMGRELLPIKYESIGTYRSVNDYPRIQYNWVQIKEKNQVKLLNLMNKKVISIDSFQTDIGSGLIHLYRQNYQNGIFSKKYDKIYANDGSLLLRSEGNTPLISWSDPYKIKSYMHFKLDTENKTNYYLSLKGKIVYQGDLMCVENERSGYLDCMNSYQLKVFNADGELLFEKSR